MSTSLGDVPQEPPAPDCDDAKSAFPITIAEGSSSPSDIGSHSAPDSAYSLVKYAQEENTGHPPPRLFKDLETRAITVPQLIREVKGIYAGLGKCTALSIVISNANAVRSHG